MRVLVVGGGGREHALVQVLAQSPLAEEIFAAPGNPGMGGLAELVDIPADDLIALRNFARVAGIDLTVVGPEMPLVSGIAEAFWEEGLKVFGPSRAAARIEGSKVFAKEVMRHAGVPAAPNAPAKAACTASSASSYEPATITPLPAARPSTLTTTG